MTSYSDEEPPMSEKVKIVDQNYHWFGIRVEELMKDGYEMKGFSATPPTGTRKASYIAVMVKL